MMRMMSMLIACCAAVLFAAGCVSSDAAKAEAQGYTITQRPTGDMLSKHSTVSRYEGTVEIPCRFRTARCPDRCSHGGTFAKFTVLKYLDYVKPGKYGDGKQSDYLVHLSKNGRPDAKLPADLGAMIRSLKPGQEVRLDWEHIYVRSPNGSRWPERPVTHLVPVAD